MYAWLALAALSAATLPAPLSPQEKSTVVYADLDLATPRGQALLDRRLRSTAIRACRSLSFGRALTSDEELPCRAAAIAGARQQALRVIARYRAHTEAANQTLLADR